MVFVNYYRDYGFIRNLNGLQWMNLITFSQIILRSLRQKDYVLTLSFSFALHQLKFEF
jgi:hypothetical protein